MARRLWLPYVALVISTAVPACGSDAPPVPWDLQFGTTDLQRRGRSVEARIVEGSCNGGEPDGPIRYRTSLRPGRSVQAPPPLPEGTYCFSGRAFDGSCRMYAEGYREVAVPWNEGSRLELEMEAVTPRTLCTPSQCDDGTCTNLTRCGDGSVDSGEQCDDANLQGSDTCRNDCTPGCEPGRGLHPVAVFDPTPGVGEICAIGNALRTDDMVAGLDRPDEGMVATLVDDEVVSACIAFDFGARMPIGAFVVRATFAEKACGTVCEEGTCSGDHFEIYVPTGGGKTLLVELPDGAIDYAFFDTYTDIGESLAGYRVTLPDEVESTRYAIVCRGGGGSIRGDIAIDAVRAVCR